MTPDHVGCLNGKILGCLLNTANQFQNWYNLFIWLIKYKLYFLSPQNNLTMSTNSDTVSFPVVVIKLVLHKKQTMLDII